MPCPRCKTGFVILEYQGSAWEQCRCIQCGWYYHDKNHKDGDEMTRPVGEAA